MKRYFLGVDIGNTKSHALIADEQGQVVGFGAAGCGNWEAVGWEQTYQVLASIINQALEKAAIPKTAIVGMGFGMAGYDWPEDDAPHAEVIGSLGIDAPFTAVNDSVIGLVAGAKEGWGVVVVGGTGSNCRGRDRSGREARTTGATWLGESGGAGSIVTKTLKAIAGAWSKRYPPTQLGDMFVAAVGAKDVTDLLAGVNRDRYVVGSKYAPLVFEAAAAGDVVAQDIIRWAGQELGSLAVGVIRQLNFEDEAFDVVLCGSIYKGGPRIISPVQATIHGIAPQARLVRLQAPPVVGGVLLGMEKVGYLEKIGEEKTAVLRATLNQTITQWFT